MDLIKASVAPVASLSLQKLCDLVVPPLRGISRLYFGLDVLPCAELAWQQLRLPIRSTLVTRFLKRVTMTSVQHPA